ncbi:hypothetical protein SAMN05216436_11856 [bacterium A37T11]|nr:hypothetical protein SAMN05216436_11856 [bacterium A37T11]
MFIFVFYIPDILITFATRTDNILFKNMRLNLFICRYIITFCLLLAFMNSCHNIKENLPDLRRQNTTMFKDMLGINGFEWDFQKDQSSELDSSKIEFIQKCFSAFRQYLEWEKIEYEEGKYRFSLDEIYENNKKLSILTLPCLQIMPKWLWKKYYPEEFQGGNSVKDLRDYTPAPSDADRSLPASYIKMAKLGFQMAARYGRNKNISPNLIRAVTWGNKDDKKCGLGSLEYLECGNEPDKNWAGPKAEQSAEEYAAELSAFYDGHMGTLGKDAGVKTADSTMKVVMAGIVGHESDFVQKMIKWCMNNRKVHGKYSLCFDVVNYHQYESVRKGEYWSNTPDLDNNHGIAPEKGDGTSKAKMYIDQIAHLNKKPEIWLTETGYDVNSNSIQRALQIDSSSTEDTQADWNLRTALLYSRIGINRVFFYMLDDVNLQNPAPYSSSGFVTGKKRRPIADFFLQTYALMGDYRFVKNISTDPLVDLYKKEKDLLYVLTIGDQINRKLNFSLKLPVNQKNAEMYKLQVGKNNMEKTDLTADSKGMVNILVTERPIFIKIPAKTN